MATNVSYANSDSILESLVLHTLPDFGPHGDGVINTNFLFSALKGKDKKEGSSKRFQVIDGGLEFWNGIMKAENSNFKWQSHTSDMTANLQDPTARLRFDIKVFTGALVINQLHKAQNKGKAMVKEFARTLREQAESTIPNQFNSAFWSSSPASTEPESIPSIISATPSTGTIGGLSRSGNAYLQNGAYTTAIADIGSEAGIATLVELIIRYSRPDMIDLVMMDATRYANLVGYANTLKQYVRDQSMAKLGFSALWVNDTMVTYEALSGDLLASANTITSQYMYGICSKHLKVKTLRDGDAVWGKEFERVGKSLNKMLPFYWFGNLTVDLPCNHFVATNVS